MQYVLTLLHHCVAFYIHRYGYKRLLRYADDDDSDGKGKGGSASGGGGEEVGGAAAAGVKYVYQDLSTNMILKQKPPPKREGFTAVVHVFDLDETLIQFDKLLDPRHAARTGTPKSAELVRFL